MIPAPPHIGYSPGITGQILRQAILERLAGHFAQHGPGIPQVHPGAHPILYTPALHSGGGQNLFPHFLAALAAHNHMQGDDGYGGGGPQMIADPFAMYRPQLNTQSAAQVPDFLHGLGQALSYG